MDVFKLFRGEEGDGKSGFEWISSLLLLPGISFLNGVLMGLHKLQGHIDVASYTV